MKLKTAVNILLVGLTLVAMGCATLETAGHKYIMRGQILEVADGMAYLCIGSADGAQVGQEYTVYKFVKLPLNPIPRSAQPYYKKEEVGTVKIVKIADQHMAIASIVAGHVGINEIIELK